MSKLLRPISKRSIVIWSILLFCGIMAFPIFLIVRISFRGNAFCRGEYVSPIESKIPVMFIQMDSTDCENIHRSKSNYAQANLLFINHVNDTLYDGEVRVKTRGNNSWNFEKKPYSLRFPKKQQFFRLDKGKSYVLLHNMLPGGGILQNIVAFELGKVLGLASPQDAIFIRLYVNNDYRGLYLLCNKMGIGVMGINISDLDKLNKCYNNLPLEDYPTFEKGSLYDPGHRKGVVLPYESEDYTGGYLLDGVTRISMYKDVSGFISDSGSMMRIREPKYATEKECEYISNVYNQMESAVRAPTGIHPITQKRWDKYLDKTSFARYYILQEVMQNGDAGMNSFCMYKDVNMIDEKMYAGPVWDFDWLLQGYSQDLWACAKQISNGSRRSTGGLLYFLWQHEDFQKQAKEDYCNILYPAIQNMIESSYLDSLCEVLYDEALADSVRWGLPWCVSVKESLQSTKSRLSRRSDFLNSIWSEDSINWVYVKMQGTIFPARDVYRYGKKDIGVRLPPYSPIINPTDPYQMYYDAVSGEVLSLDTIFYTNRTVVVHHYYPSWMEIQERRIVFAFRKMRNKISVIF